MESKARKHEPDSTLWFRQSAGESGSADEVRASVAKL